MKILKDNKGFTLVELLAVIVILAVVMLIAVTAIGPLMEKSRKGALGSEGLGAVDAAKLAYQATPMTDTTFPSGQSVCFTIEWLCQNNYYEKGCTPTTEKPDDNYNGSVMVSVDDGDTYTYTFWISNGTYKAENVISSTYSIEKVDASSAVASETCGNGTVAKIYKMGS